MGWAESLLGIKEAKPNGRMERMAKQAGYTVDGTSGKAILLDFDALDEFLFITDGDAKYVIFGVVSKVKFNPDSVPAEVMQFALMQNEDSLLGRWKMSIDDEKVRFSLTYVALGAALDPVAVRTICDDIVETATTFERQMKKDGYL